jgi:hypothetical protein
VELGRDMTKTRMAKEGADEFLFLTSISSPPSLIGMYGERNGLVPSASFAIKRASKKNAVYDCHLYGSAARLTPSSAL